MATTVTNTVIDTDTAITLSNFEDIYVSEAGVVISSDDVAILAAGDGHDITIAGEVFGESVGIQAGFVDTVPFSTRIKVTEEGTVLSHGTALQTTGSSYRFTNSGVISGTRGIEHSGGSADVVNFGEISGSFGVAINLDTNGGSLVNGGLIYSPLSTAILLFNSTVDGGATATVTNTGTIHSGFNAIQGTQSSRDNIQNFGTMIGNLSMVGGDDMVRNAGLIIGDVQMGAGNDTYDGREGTVEGTVFGSTGDDLYIVTDDRTELTEFEGQGLDTVESEMSHVLGDHFEDLDLIGTQDANGIGNGENNDLNGNGGDNRLNGKDGDDNITGVNGNDTVVGSGGSDTLNGGDGQDVARGGNGADTLNGGLGDDVVKGGAGDDKVSGGDGDDTIWGGLGQDRLFGNGGSDRFVFNNRNESPNDSGADNLRDFELGVDVIDLTGLNPALRFIGDTAFSGTAGEVRVSQNDSGDSIVRIDLDGDSIGDMKINVRDVTGLTVADFDL